MLRYVLLFLIIGATPVMAKSVNCNPDQTANQCMACNIYHEARGEDHLGQIRVGLVTMYRVQSSAYPDTVCEVVWQTTISNSTKKRVAQFSWTLDGRSDVMRDDDDRLASYINATLVMGMFQSPMGEFLAHNILPPTTMWYHNKTVKPEWSKRKQLVMLSGDHIFYQKHPAK